MSMTPRAIDRETGEIIEGEELTRQRAAGMLKQAYDAKAQKSQAEGLLLALMGTNDRPGPLREWALAHPQDELEDGEHGLYLEAKFRGSGDRCDLMSLAEKHSEVVLKLAALGLLKLDMTAWKAHSKDFIEADIAKRFIYPGGQSLALEVKER